MDKFASAGASGSPFLGHLLMGCTLQACKALWLSRTVKNESRNSDRDVSGLLDRRSYTKGAGATPHRAQAGRGSSLSYSGRTLPFIGELMSGGRISCRD